MGEGMRFAAGPGDPWQPQFLTPPSLLGIPSTLTIALIQATWIPRSRRSSRCRRVHPIHRNMHAVTAGAAAAVLEYLFPDQATEFADMADEAATSRVMAGVAFPSDAFSGLDLGQSIGREVIAFAQSDGSGQVFNGSYPPSPGVWSSSTPVTPLAGSWKPWVITSAQDFRLGPPPVFGSDVANTQYAGVKNLSLPTPSTTWPGSGSPGFSSLGSNRPIWRSSRITWT